MLKFIKSLYLNSIVYFILGGLVFLYIVGFFMPLVTTITSIILFLLFVVVIVDILLLYSNDRGIETNRRLKEKLSNGDKNPVNISIKNLYKFPIKVNIIDEVPFQFQLRDFNIKLKLKKEEEHSLMYNLVPKERGEYDFGICNIYVSFIGLVSRRFKRHEDVMLKSYPSFIHLQEYELMALKNEFLLGGNKKIRKLGQALEFEQLKEYVVGDDIRSINWKATSKRNQLIVNQYQEERSQRVYMLIDKGRTMQMPFNGMSLLDYAINASMALSHIILKKKDHPGVMTFSNTIEDQIQASAKGNQLRRIADKLYNIDTNFIESDYGQLYSGLRNTIKRRSLVMLFSNFETLDSLKRQLKYLRAISKSHVLIIVLFKNSELTDLIESSDKTNVQSVYDQIIAEKFEYEKKLISNELMKYGIQSIYTKPEDLSISVINKYIEVKSRGLI